MCQKLAEQYPFIKGPKNCKHLFNQEMGLLPAPFYECGVCEQGFGGGGKGSPPLEMGQDKEKPLQEPDSVQTTILTPTPSKHSPGGTEKRFKPKSQGRPVISFCHPFCGSAQGPGQSQGHRRRREIQASSEGSGHPLNTGPAGGVWTESKMGVALPIFKLLPSPT